MYKPGCSVFFPLFSLHKSPIYGSLNVPNPCILVASCHCTESRHIPFTVSLAACIHTAITDIITTTMQSLFKMTFWRKLVWEEQTEVLRMESLSPQHWISMSLH